MTVAAAIRERTQHHTAALNEAGAPHAGEFFTADADLLPPGPDNLDGRDAIGAFCAKVTEHYHQVRLTADSVQALGPDVAQADGTYWAAARAEGGAPVSGKWVMTTIIVNCISERTASLQS